MAPSSDDHRFMHAALTLARRGLGRTWPNPAVGCVIVKDGAVVGRGWTQPGGRPHAETEALKRAGAAAKGATAYVTLEPCSHHGRTPPCAEALIAAGIKRVAAAIEDPNPQVSGRGFELLRKAGIAVVIGEGADVAREINAGFLTRLSQGRPLVTLKLATSLDGRIAAKGGDSKWITGEVARARAHLLRAMHDAVMIGMGTAIMDDPELTCRLPGMDDRSPIRIVMDSQARLSLESRLAQSARQRSTWVIAREDADRERLHAFHVAGIDVTKVPARGGHADPVAALQALGKRGLTRVLVEGGGRLAASLLKADLVDRIVWFRAPVLIGGDGVAAVDSLDIASVAAARRFVCAASSRVGADLMESYRRAG